QVDSGGERRVVPAEPLDDRRLGLLYDTDATRDDRDCEQHDRRRNDQRANVVHAPCPPQLSLSTYNVAPSTRTTITRVPGSSGASISAASRQSSPSTTTRPLPVPGSMLSDTMPTRPARASTLVLISRAVGWRCFSRYGRGLT